jgi:8-oxo-dGTP diphosphatase
MTEQKPGAGFGVMILNGREILLGHRNKDPKKASSLLHGEGSWTMPGGKLHFKENLKEGAIREVFEETGIRVKNLKVISVSNDIVPDAHFVTIGFLTEDFEGEAKVMEPDEIIEWNWFSLDNLPSPLYFPSEKIMKNYLAGKIYQDE